MLELVLVLGHRGLQQEHQHLMRSWRLNSKSLQQQLAGSLARLLQQLAGSLARLQQLSCRRQRLLLLLLLLLVLRRHRR